MIYTQRSLTGDDCRTLRQTILFAITLALALLGALPVSASQFEDAIATLGPYAGQTVTDVTISGHNKTKDYVIERELYTETGEPLDLEIVMADLVRLENLSIFGSVTVAATPNASGVAVEYQFVELPTLIPYPALSYTEANGFSIGLGIASPNFTGRDITLSASVLVGGAETASVTVGYPWITGNHFSINARAWHKIRQHEILDYEETTDLFEIILGTYLGYHGRASLTGILLNLKSDKDDITLSPDNSDFSVGLGGALEYDTRDSWRNPRMGWRGRSAVTYLGGDPNTWLLDVDLRFFHPIGDKNAFATGPLLSMQSGNVGEEIPSYMQYFLGGANSIRGYKLKELGLELFGKNQLLYTFEYRHLVRGIRPFKILKWTISIGLEAAAFADVGTAWSYKRDLSLDRTRAGFGAGLRILLPAIERVRFDVAIGDRGDIVFNFGVLSNFEARTQRIR